MWGFKVAVLLFDDVTPSLGYLGSGSSTLWLFNIAMENPL
jgi:hypothetical protein